MTAGHANLCRDSDGPAVRPDHDQRRVFGAVLVAPERSRPLPFGLTSPRKSAKSRRRMRLQLLAGLLLATIATAKTPPKPVRLVAEAEDFTVKSGWQVTPYRENYFASTFAVTFLSRMGCLTAAEQGEAIAEQVVEIPVADEYQVFARYEQPYNFSCEFTIEIEQGGKVVARHEFGRLADPKI